MYKVDADEGIGFKKWNELIPSKNNLKMETMLQLIKYYICISFLNGYKLSGCSRSIWLRLADGLAAGAVKSLWNWIQRPFSETLRQ